MAEQDNLARTIFWLNQINGKLIKNLWYNKNNTLLLPHKQFKVDVKLNLCDFE